MSPAERMGKALEEYAHDRFVNDVADHEMLVLKDDDLYRHLLFKKPGTSTYWYEIVTWRGALVIRGDMGCWGFSRTDDMFAFFREKGLPRINADYWSEKLWRENQPGAREFSMPVYGQSVRDWLDQEAEYLLGDLAEPKDFIDEAEEGEGWDLIPGDVDDAHEKALVFHELRDQVMWDLLSPHDPPFGKDDAMRRLSEFNFEHGQGSKAVQVTIDEYYEFAVEDYTFQFLWCCWALVHGIAQYDALAGVSVLEEVQGG